jgi:hypothetical protein
MDDLTLIRDFRAERDDGDPRARDAAWRELEAMFEPASAPPASPTRSPRRGLLALAGAGALAAIVAGILVLGSGPTAQPAAAEVLHQAAVVAASGEGVPALSATPDQYYFTKMKAVEFEGWIPGGVSVPGGPVTSQHGGFSAQVPKETEAWLSPQGGDRIRQTMGTPKFLSSAEQIRWEQAGSPLPLGFDPRYDKALVEASEEGGDRRYLEQARGVLDVEDPKPNGGSGPENFPDLSNVPTDPKQLRLAIQSGQAPGISEPGGHPLGLKETTEDLEGLLTLTHPNASPALRAAAFNALAEIPGFELNRDATDLLGRAGYGISYDRGHGERAEFIIDPQTSKFLGERIVLADPGLEPQWKGYEAGLTIRDVAYLQSAVVDSTGEPAEEGQGGGPVATTGPVYHR